MKHGALTAAAALLTAAVSSASASEIVDRDATGVRLVVSRSGLVAMLTYRAQGHTRHVRISGAIDARAPSETQPQVRFRRDYSGGKWRGFRGSCLRYDGPQLAWLVKACKARDGSYWAVQSWPRGLPNNRLPTTASEAASELHVSHWRGPAATLEVWTGWGRAAPHLQHIFGRLTYHGVPVHGFRTTRDGIPTDTYGRILYLDTLNSDLGHGWRRTNSFVSHNPLGVFCHTFATASGERYRITVPGPGVTPDVMWEGPGLHVFDPANPADVAEQQQSDAAWQAVMAGDGACAPER